MNPGSRLAAVDSAPLPFFLQRVSLVLSAPADTSPAHFPEVGGACWTPLPLRPLPPPERADLLGAELRRWGRSFERRYVSGHAPPLLHKPRPLDLLRHLGGGVSGGETDVSSDQ